jgi:hypothetical protein
MEVAGANRRWRCLFRCSAFVLKRSRLCQRFRPERLAAQTPLTSSTGDLPAEFETFIAGRFLI